MTQEFVTLPREVVEQALAAFEHLVRRHYMLGTEHDDRAKALRAALEQPQNHVPDVWNMVPAGWKLAPIEPTDNMLYDIQEFSHILPPRGKRIWAHMLAAAPQPPVVEQPQGEQEPVGEAGSMPGTDGFTMACFRASNVPVGTKLYTNPQPKRKPLPDHYINGMFSAASIAEGDMFRRFARAIEAAHNIK